MNPSSDKDPIASEGNGDSMGSGDVKIIDKEEMIEGKKNGENGKIITRTGLKAMNPYKSRAHTTNETCEKSSSGLQPTAPVSYTPLTLPTIYSC